MKKSVFEFSTYLEIINFEMERGPEKWGLISKIAEAIGCQRSHLSRVISGQVHLTPEQADSLSLFWHFNESESEYFINLVALERAGTKSLKSRIQRQISKIKQEQENLNRRLKQPALESEGRETIYYSAWYWSAIHISVSIPEFQNVKNISRRLSLSESLVQYCLENLEQLGLVRKEGQSWKFSSHTIHLPRQSALTGTHHNNWRSRSSLSAQDPLSDGIHYTTVQSVSKEDFLKIRQLLLSTIDEYSTIAGPSKEEELICFTCDTFRV